MRVAIVGGGWAGLAAAVELAKAGVAISVFESARQLGGRARSVDAHGRRLDNGQHILIGAYRETLRLMREVGADPEQLLKRVPLELNFPGPGATRFRLRLPRLPAPWHLIAGLLGTRGASLGEKFAAARCLRSLQATAYRLEADGTVSALLDAQQQHGRLRSHLWEALCLAALNTPPERASAQVFVNTLRDSIAGDRAASDLLLPTVELDQLFPAAAAAFIAAHGGQIHCSARVTAIADGLRIGGQRFDRVVLAVGPQHAATLLAGHPATADCARLLAEYRFEPIATVYCGYPAHFRLPFAMLGLSPDDGRQPVGQWVFDRGALCGTAGVLAFVLSGHGAWEALEQSMLVTTLERELAATLQTALPASNWQQVIRERRATFSCRPDLRRPPARTARAGLWLAGDYVCAEYPATLEAAVRSGVATARDILLASSHRAPAARQGS